MTTDDDKQSPEPDPWAGLDIGNADNGDDAGAFDFASLEDEPSAPFQPVVDEPSAEAAETFAFETMDHPVGEPSSPVLHDDQDAPANEIPLAVFPPPEVEVEGSEILIGTGRSGIIPMAEAGEDLGSQDFASGDLANDEFDDNDIAHELGLADIDAEQMAEDAGGGPGMAADFGEPVGEMSSEDVSFDAGASAGEFPFADADQVEDPFGVVSDASESGYDAASIAVSSAAAATAGVAAVATTPVAKQAGRKTKGSALGQMVGVVLGGLMALPVTYAILVWGFHKDPFKLAKQAPPQLAFLLPEKLQPGTRPSSTKTPKKTGKADMAAGLNSGPSLDDLPTGDDVATVVGEPSSDAGDDEPTAVPEPTDVADSTDDAAATVGPGTPDGEPAEMAHAAETAPKPEEPVAPSGDAVADLAIAPPPMAAAGLDAIDPVPGLDELAATADAVPPAAVPAALPPLDMTGVERAVERVSQAFDALGAISDRADPARDRLAVTWYKRLVQLDEELVRLETAAADSGRPLEQSPAAVARLLDSICESETAREDLEKLGRMWLTRQQQRADGVTLLATLDSARQVGPYWSTTAIVSGARPDGGDRKVAVISRFAPPAAAGERIVISGVLFDGDTVWAADVRPVDRPAQVDFGQE
ncbi:MAG: hypothetical protein ACKO6B_02435 [Planctomycetia bacterium]